MVSSLGALTNRAAINICAQVLCELKFSVLQGVHSGLGFLGHVLDVCLIVYKTACTQMFIAALFIMTKK